MSQLEGIGGMLQQTPKLSNDCYNVANIAACVKNPAVAKLGRRAVQHTNMAATSHLHEILYISLCGDSATLCSPHLYPFNFGINLFHRRGSAGMFRRLSRGAGGQGLQSASLESPILSERRRGRSRDSVSEAVGRWSSVRRDGRHSWRTHVRVGWLLAATSSNVTVSRIGSVAVAVPTD
jgi:hypothetical protein